MTKLIFERLDQRASARRAAPTTSLSGLMLAPGESIEVDSATSMVFLGQCILRTVCAEGSNSKESRISSRSLEPRAKNNYTLAIMATGYCIRAFLARAKLTNESAEHWNWGSGQPT